MTAISEAVMGTSELIQRRVVLEGVTAIMFDRYAGDNDTKLEPWQKLYLQNGTENKLVVGLPSGNLMSFLSAQNTKSAPKRLLDSRKYRKASEACLSFVLIAPEFIPFTRNGSPIVLGKKLQKPYEKDDKSGIWLRPDVARLEDGIPNPKLRPVLDRPWELGFTLSIFPNREIQETQIATLIREGGLALGLGTFRGQFGKFAVKVWEELKS